MDTRDVTFAGSEEKHSGELSKMQKTFMKSSIGLRGRSKRTDAPATKKAASADDESGPTSTVEVLSSQQYAEMMADVERPTTYVLLYLFLAHSSNELCTH